MKREFIIFIKRNKIQLLIALVCIVLNIKQTSIPFLFEYNLVTSFMFEKIPETNNLFEVIDIINNLGFAYYSSLIFYFVVDYFPNRKKEKMAFKLIKDNVSNIIVHLDCLFKELLFFCNFDASIERLNISIFQIKQMVSLHLTLETVECNKTIIDKTNGEIITKSQCETLSSFDTIQNECKSIINEINFINNHVCISQLEGELVNILSILNKNQYLDNMIHLNRNVFTFGCSEIVCNCKVLDFLELLKISFDLCKLPVEQYACILEKSTENDRQEVLQSLNNIKKNYPKSFEMLQKIQNNNDK